MNQYLNDLRRRAGLPPLPEMQTALSRQQEEDLTSKLARAGMSSVQYIGETIDKPMAAIRGALAGKPAELLNAIPFSDTIGLTSSEGWLGGTPLQMTDDENTVYGRDLLETYGVLGENKEGFGGSGSWSEIDMADAVGDVLGFGVDLIGLPVGAGAKALTKGGQALAKLGLLDEAAVAAGRMGKSASPAAMGTVGEALAMTQDPLESLAALSRSAKASGDDLSRLYNQRVGYKAALRPPLGMKGGVMSLEGVVNPVLSAAARVPGAKTLGNAASGIAAATRGTLYGPAANMFGRQAQKEFAPYLQQLRGQYERNARDIVSEATDVVNRNQEAFTKLGDGDITSGIYDLYESPLLGPTAVKGRILQESGADVLKDLERSHGRVRQALDTIPGIQNELGVSSNMLEDEFVNYMKRSVLGKPGTGAGTRTVAGIDAAGTVQRSDFLKNIPGGTGTLRRLAQSITDQGDRAFILRKAEELGVPEDQLSAVASFLQELDPAVLKAGVYTDPLNAMHRRLQSAARGRANAEAAADVLGDVNALDRSINPEFYGTGETSTLENVAKKLGMQSDVFLRQAALRGGIDVDTGNLAKAAGLERFGPEMLDDLLGSGPVAAPEPRTLRQAMEAAKDPIAKEAQLQRLAAERNLTLEKLLDKQIGQTTREFGKTRIGQRFADDITNLNPDIAGPGPTGKLIDAIDSVTSLFKGSVTAPFPSFHVRNRASGIVRELLAGNNSVFGLAGRKPADRIASKISRGELLDDADRALLEAVPDIKAYMDQGSTAEDALRRMAYRDMPGQGQGYALDVARDPVRQSAAQTVDEVTDIGLAGGIGGSQGFSPLEALRKAKFWGEGWQQKMNPMNQRGVLQGEGALGKSGLAGTARAETKFAPSATGQYVGEHAENMNRIAPYLNRIFEGADPTQAAKRVLETQIDYSGNALSKFERDYLTRLIPFYKFSRGNLPYVAKEVATDLGGRTAALLKAPNAVHRARDTENQILPDYVAESLAIPLGTNKDGSEQFLRGLGLMEEDVFGIVDPQNPVRGLLREIGARTNPIVKAPIEYMTNQSLFQQGRPLDQMDPTLGRIVSNIKALASGEEQKLPAWRPTMLDHLFANLPSARAATTLRQLTDKRKLPEMLGGLEGNTGGGLLANLLSGLSLSDVSPGAMDKQLRDLVGDSYSSVGGRSFETIYIPEEVKAQMTPAQLQEVEKLNALKRLLTQRRKARAQAAGY